MNDIALIAALVVAALAGALHVYIFVLESVRWTAPKTRAVFGIRTAELAEATKPLAFNQGFYNLFLAIEVFLGIVLFITGATVVAATLVFVGTGSMVAAALVLILSDRTKARAALTQGVIPLLAVALLALALAL